MNQSDVTLYGFETYDRSGKVSWILNEIGLEFTFIKLDHGKKDNETPNYLGKHPLAAVPVLEYGGITMHESNGICAYLAFRHPSAKLLPDMGTKEFAECMQWLHFNDGTLDAAKLKTSTLRMTHDYPTDAKDKDGKSLQDLHLANKADAHEDLQTALATLEKELQGKEYLCGDFSVGDIAIAYSLKWTMIRGGLTAYPTLIEYLKRAASRPAAVKSGAFSNLLI